MLTSSAPSAPNAPNSGPRRTRMVTRRRVPASMLPMRRRGETGRALFTADIRGKHTWTLRATAMAAVLHMWKCVLCQYANDPRLEPTHCHKCGQPRPDLRPSAPSAPQRDSPRMSAPKPGMVPPPPTSLTARDGGGAAENRRAQGPEALALPMALPMASPMASPMALPTHTNPPGGAAQALAAPRVVADTAVATVKEAAAALTAPGGPTDGAEPK